jgi:hypothetical protein
VQAARGARHAHPQPLGVEIVGPSSDDRRMPLSVSIDLLHDAMGLVVDDLKADSAGGDDWAAAGRHDFIGEHGDEGVDALVGLASYLVHLLAAESEVDPVPLAAEILEALIPPDGSAWKHKRRGPQEGGR